MKNSHAYIFVHDQDIIKEYEKTKKISKTFGKEYSYVFVGYNELNLDNSNIISGEAKLTVILVKFFLMELSFLKAIYIYIIRF